MRLLILGLGYSARHALAHVRGPAETPIAATTRSADKAARLAEAGLEPIVYDGTAPSPSLSEAIRAATHILVSAGPSAAGDPFLAHHARDVEAAARAGTLAWIGYWSTIGVFGDTGGAFVDDRDPPNPMSERTRWRVAAEEGWTRAGAAGGVPVALLRLGGIYGPGRNAFVNLAAGTAKRVIRPGQMFNRIHVDDIGRVTAEALAARAAGPISVVDDEPAPPQDPITFAASLMGVAPPPEVPFDEAEFTPMALSFWAENRRVRNTRVRGELAVALAYPSYREGLKALWDAGTWAGTPDDREEASPRFKRGKTGG